MEASDPSHIIIPLQQEFEIITHQLDQHDLVNLSLVILDDNFFLELGHPPD